MTRREGAQRGATLAAVGAAIADLRTPGEVVRVAVDGVDGAGKTVFADELSEVLKHRGLSVMRASVDGFHNPPEVRYRRGRHSPQGFFRDSYDYAALKRLLLDPIVERDRQVVRRIYDVEAEAPVEPIAESAADVDVLVFDGIFLHRPELRHHWDYTIYLDVGFDVSIPRGAQRGYGEADPDAPSNRRYVQGQQIYLRECRPRHHATCVIDNTVLDDAHVVDL